MNIAAPPSSSSTVDVCIIVEGTYPYVTGGVSAWIHQLIGALPDIRFGILHIAATLDEPSASPGPRGGEAPARGYELPTNVATLVTVGIHGGDEPPAAGKRRSPSAWGGRGSANALGEHGSTSDWGEYGSPSARCGRGSPSALDEDMSPGTSGEDGSPTAWDEARTFHDEMQAGHVGGLGEMLRRLCPAAGRGASAHELLYGKRSWEVVRQLYEERASDVSFLNYFWTWRFTHLPIFRLLHARIPDAAVYHTVSTGWAGLIAAIVRARTGRPMLLTEHGIYARERRLEIDQANWIYVQRQLPMTLAVGPGFFKELWSRLFYRLSRITYAHADLIVTIFEGNRQAQILDGADPAKTLVIPNGIDVESFGRLPRVPAAPGEFRVGFVGRVVPIKDVKTFIRAFKIVAEAVPGARGVVVGPTDEDAEYFAECRALAETLQLGSRLAFTGPAEVRNVYPNLDVVVLTSLSEGLPLVMLEASAVGLPVVATDVGGCRELLQGRDRDDRALGASGLVTAIADPAATAAAILALARDPGLRLEFGRAGQRRVRRYYQEADLIQRYRAIYERHTRGVRRDGEPGMHGRATTGPPSTE
jgi:polysaccharide biosynthesis protein PelF